MDSFLIRLVDDNFGEEDDNNFGDPAALVLALVLIFVFVLFVSDDEMDAEADAALGRIFKFMAEIKCSVFLFVQALVLPLVQPLLLLLVVLALLLMLISIVLVLSSRNCIFADNGFVLPGFDGCCFCFLDDILPPGTAT